MDAARCNESFHCVHILAPLTSHVSAAFNMGSKLSLSGKPPQNPPSKYPPPYENYVEDADYEKSNTFEQQQEVDDFLMNAQMCQEIDYSEQQQQGCGNPFGRCGCSLHEVHA